MGGRRASLWWEATGAPSAPPLVLVPDAQRPAAAWPPALVRGLEAAGWRVVRLDLRHQGRSAAAGPAGDGRCDVADLVADVAEVTACVGADHPAHLLGHGLGATIALELALAARPAGGGGGAAAVPPTAIGGVTVVGGTGWLADPSLPGPDEPVAVGLVWRSRIGEGPGLSLARALARELRLLACEHDDPGAAALDEVERWLAWGCNPGDEHGRAWLEAPPRWSALGHLDVPLCVVHGEHDPLVPAAHGRRLAAVVPGARHVEVPGAGHALTPPLVAALLGELAAGDGLGAPGQAPGPAGGSAKSRGQSAST